MAGAGRQQEALASPNGLWLSYTSVLLGLELQAGRTYWGSGPRPSLQLPPPPHPSLPPSVGSASAPHFLPEHLVLLLQDLVLYGLRDIRHEPGRNELDAQGHVLGEQGTRAGWRGQDPPSRGFGVWLERAAPPPAPLPWGWPTSKRIRKTRRMARRTQNCSDRL